MSDDIQSWIDYKEKFAVMTERTPGCGCQYYRALEVERDAFRVELNKLIALNNAHEALIDHVLERSLFGVLAALPRSLLPLAEASRRRVFDKDSQSDGGAES